MGAVHTPTKHETIINLDDRLACANEAIE